MNKSSESNASISSHYTGAITATVNSSLANASSFKAFLKENEYNMIDQNLSKYLMMLLKHKKLKRSQVVKASGLEKSYVFQIFKGQKNPSRNKLIAIAFGMQLTAEETQRMLKIAGHSELYPRIKRDAIILYAIQRGINIWRTDRKLDEYNLPTLLPKD